ncbi:hypothetical protein LTR08_000185 [Meristemomyces frigidus]|nr:hypothetical protein LTR08_000185 [Meristemomyces frigidus]
MATFFRTATTLASSSVCRACLRTQPIRPASQRISSIQQRASGPSISVRWHSVPSGSKAYTFEQMKQYTDSPSPSRIIIDVREPSEYAQGHLPHAINIPIKSQPDALFLPADEFEDRFGFSKPSADEEVVFYCKSGVRSSAAAQLATQVGYKDVAEYRGSWLDWTRKGGQEVRPGEGGSGKGGSSGGS